MDIAHTFLTYDPFASACAPPLSYDATIAITIVASIIGIAWTGYHLLMLRRIDLTVEQETEGEEGLIEDMPEEQRKLLLEFGYKVYDAALQFLKLQYLFCLILVILAFLLLWFLSELGSPAAITFLIGAFVSLVAGIVGIVASMRLSSKISYSSKFGLAPSFRTAYQSASVIAFSTVSLHLLALTVTTHVLKQNFSLSNSSTQYQYYRKLFESLAGYGLGASLVSLFNKLGGSIFETATEAASEISNKSEGSLPHLHPRNPTTVAKHAGINVGGIIGQNSDLLGSYSQLTCVALLLSSTSLLGWQGDKTICAEVLSALTLPLLILACGLISSVGVSFAGAVVAWTETEQNLSHTLRMQRILSAGIMAGLLYLCAYLTLPTNYQLIGVNNTYKTIHAPWEAYICALAGTISSLLLSFLAEIATHKQLPFLNAFAEKCKAGTAATVTLGLAFGYLALVLPTVIFCLTAFFTYGILGFYGVSIAALAFLSITPLQLALQSTGPLTSDSSTAAGIAGLSQDEKQSLAQLEYASLSTSSINRNINMICSALVGMSLLGGFLRNAKLDTPASETAISLNDPLIFSGLLIGAILPFLISGLAAKGSRRATALLLEQTQRQLREDEGIVRGQSQADYAGSVRPASFKVVQHMIGPILLVLATPMVLGLAIGPKIITGLLLGIIVSSFQFSLSTTTSGDAWSSARKFIQSGMLTDLEGRVLGEGSQAHIAVVIGTGVGTAFQKCAGGLLNPAIKLMGMLAVLFGSKFAILHS